LLLPSRPLEGLILLCSLTGSQRLIAAEICIFKIFHSLNRTEFCCKADGCIDRTVMNCKLIMIAMEVSGLCRRTTFSRCINRRG
jgi:hypothetical protein